MISLDMAKRLKEAGLKWVPQVGDWFRTEKLGPQVVYLGWMEVGNDPETSTDAPVLCPAIIRYRHAECIWLPRLDQMIQEIDQREFWWEIKHVLVDSNIKKYKARISKKHNTSIPEKIFSTTTPDESAALALEWILKGEA